MRAKPLSFKIVCHNCKILELWFCLCWKVLSFQTRSLDFLLRVYETFDCSEDTGDKLSNVMSMPCGVLITLNILVTCFASTKRVEKKSSKTMVSYRWTTIIVLCYFLSIISTIVCEARED